MEFMVRRFTVVSERSFETTLRRLVEAIGASDLMEVFRFDASGVLNKARVPSKESTAQDSRIIRLLVGNPVIMKEMARTAPDAAAYAPITILIDERSDGVRLSYDLMSSLIAPYDSPDALAIANDLDAKIIALLENAAVPPNKEAGIDEARDNPNDPIATCGSLAAADMMLMGVFLNEW
jgi:uncharacterized protein (DUF302 family)